ncbi:MAG: 4-hydroxy-tetrahydrodipicolinate reductase [Candidatus Edwardsbacteria bacterium]
MINVIICGACGKMGTHLVSMISQQKDMKIIAGIEVPGHDLLGQRLRGSEAFISDDLSKVIEFANVVIEFTNPKTSLEHLRVVSKANKPMIIGTTGFQSDELKEIKSLTEKIPCVFSPNMSIGVNLLFKIVKDVAGILGDDYDIEITEAHHRLKRDAPSGTAQRLAEILSKTRSQKIDDCLVYGRKGMIGERKKGEIGIFAIRGGDIVGEHTVMFAGPGERIELTHRVHSRDTFAYGTLAAIRFVVKAKPGLYNMQEVLGLL